MASMNRNNHFKNLPRKGTVVALLDRQVSGISSTKYALVVERVKRNGKLRLAFLGSNGKINYTIAVPNGSDWARNDKSIRFRWSYSSLTSPGFPSEEVSSSPKAGRTRKVGEVHSVTAQSTGSRPTAQA